MDMNAFSKENRARCESPKGFNHKLTDWSLSDWIVAIMGEFGEAANVLKKLNRVRDDIPGNSETPEQLRQMLADELADTVIYIDLTAQAQHLRMDMSEPSIAEEGPETWNYSDYMAVIGNQLGRAAWYAPPEVHVDPAALRMTLRTALSYLYMMTRSMGLDLSAAVRSKFDRTSAKIGYVADAR